MKTLAATGGGLWISESAENLSMKNLVVRLITVVPSKGNLNHLSVHSVHLVGFCSESSNSLPQSHTSLFHCTNARAERNMNY